MDASKFFAGIRPLFGGHLSQPQVDGINAILAGCEKHNVTDLRYIAYMLGTTWWEADKTMQPIRENGRGAGHRYGEKIKENGLPYTTPDQIYYGRGFVQMTWYENYALFSRLLNIDLLNNPDLALTLPVATDIMIDGMLNGLFTGARLSRFFNDSITDWINARKIINGLDQAQTIANAAETFYNALKTASVTN